MKIAILGFGREGRSLLKFLKTSPKFKSAQIRVLDKKSDEHYLKNLSDFDLIFRSPGVPYNLPEIQKAAKNAVKISSATKLFFDLCPAPIIGITGTKGKGTTATLLYKILKTCSDQNRKIFLAGNIGKPALDIIPKITKKSLVILELSSFQLQDLAKSPAVSAVTDVFPDHLDTHKNMTEYINAKSNIGRFQKKSDVIFYFKDNPLSKKIAGQSPGKKIGLSGEPFALKKNFVMAGAIAAYLNCPTEKIIAVIKKFKGLRHRLELIASKNGMQFYNDSASTNPQTAALAIQSLSDDAADLFLIAGGKDKNLDYSPLAAAIKQSGRTKMAILFGENKKKINNAIKKFVPVKLTKDLKSAVQFAYLSAKHYSLNAVILFSPASASFDMFKDYQDRGEKFKLIVKRL